MNNKTLKFTAAAIVFITVLLGVGFFGDLTNSSSVAWADVPRLIEANQPER